ncbi:MAG: hypothetical protein ACYC5Q_05695 [Thermoleophilia bacterium]
MVGIFVLLAALGLVAFSFHGYTVETSSGTTPASTSTPAGKDSEPVFRYSYGEGLSETYKLRAEFRVADPKSGLTGKVVIAADLFATVESFSEQESTLLMEYRNVVVSAESPAEVVTTSIPPFKCKGYPAGLGSASSEGSESLTVLAQIGDVALTAGTLNSLVGLAFDSPTRDDRVLQVGAKWSESVDAPEGFLGLVAGSNPAVEGGEGKLQQTIEVEVLNLDNATETPIATLRWSSSTPMDASVDVDLKPILQQQGVDPGSIPGVSLDQLRMTMRTTGSIDANGTAGVRIVDGWPSTASMHSVVAETVSFEDYPTEVYEPQSMGPVEARIEMDMSLDLQE